MSNMMSLFEKAAELNNQGVNSLFSGDSKSAIDDMAASIKLLKQELGDLWLLT